MWNIFYGNARNMVCVCDLMFEDIFSEGHHLTVSHEFVHYIFLPFELLFHMLWCAASFVKSGRGHLKLDS